MTAVLICFILLCVAAVPLFLFLYCLEAVVLASRRFRREYHRDRSRCINR